MNAAIRPEAFLGNLALFRELAPAELARIAAATRPLRVSRGELLFNRGDPSTGMHLIVYGQVKLAFVSPRGEEKVVDILGPGESFGEATMFLQQPHIVGAQALADSLLLFISRAAVFEELERDPVFARRIIGSLAKRLHHRVTDLEAVSMRTGTQRVIGYLLGESAQGPGEEEQPLDVTLPTSKGIVASRLNLTQEHFSRILHELSAAGLIEVRGRTIVIRDIARLRAHGECGRAMA